SRSGAIRRWCSRRRSRRSTCSRSRGSSCWWPRLPACSRRGRPRAWIRSRRCVVYSRILLALALAVAPLGGAPARALDGDELLRQVDRRLNPESYEMYRKLINIEPDGRSKEYVLYTVKKGRDRMIALFLDPPSEKGRATLRLGDNMW